jgi:hypothetical protein
MIPSKELNRIIENENIRVTLEHLNIQLDFELGECNYQVPSKEDETKYGVRMESLLASVLVKYLKIKNK